jgi:two-component system, NtrC family, nitrogen regulation sensor histidine kinase NtrY
VKFRDIPGLKFLLLAIACFLIAAAFRFLFIDFGYSKEAIARQLELNVDRELSLSQLDADRVFNSFEPSRIREAALPTDTKYPYFIYQDGNLVYWSDFTLVPSYFEIADNRSTLFVRLRNGYHISRRFESAQASNTYEVYFLVPVFYSPGIENQYLRPFFNENLIKNNYFTVSEDISPEAQQNIAFDGQFLFSISFPEGFKGVNPLINHGALVLSLLSLVFIFLFLRSLSNSLRRSESYWEGLFILVIALASLRFLMLSFNFPFSGSLIGLFNPRNYASSFFNPSLGDLIINIMVVVWIIWYAFDAFFRLGFLKSVKQLGLPYTTFLPSALGILAFLGLYSVYFFSHNISGNSQWSLDITSSLYLGYLRWVSMGVLSLCGLLYFLFFHLYFRACQFVFSRSGFVQAYFGITIFVGIGALLLNIKFWPLVLIHVVFSLLVWLFKLPTTISRPGYLSFSYFFLTAMAVAAAASSGEYNFQIKQLIAEKEKLGAQLLMENDPYTEFILNEVSTKIKDDIFIKNRLLNPYLSNDVIEQKIRRAYIQNNFDKYDVRIHLFDNRGEPIITREDPTLQDWYNAFAYRELETEFSNIFLIPEQGQSVSRRYLSFVEIKRPEGFNLGFVIVDLTLKRFFPNTVYPELLVDRSFFDQNLERKYDYGIYKNGALVFSGGNFSYPRFVFDSDLDNIIDLPGGAIEDNYHHYVYSGEGGKLAIISSSKLPFRNWMANFSFHFLFAVFLIILLVIIHVLTRQHKRVMSYVSRIQIGLNLAFFIPLFIISATTLSRINAVSRQEIINNYFKKAENVAQILAPTLESYRNQFLNTDEFLEEVFKLARIIEADINLYNTNGQLFATSQPAVFENYLLSELLNPQAKLELSSFGKNRIILNESIGTLGFRTVYLPIRSPETGNNFGVLGMPFFESQAVLENQQIEVLSNILITFTIVFIIFLAIAYVVADVLTYPFRYISQKLKRISLTSLNQPLEWKSEDEIGLMVSEYNKMLLNLENSKEALAQSQKESAWREMAQQVAHEIKNPLTPMKLTLQHMQRIIEVRDLERLKNLDKSINSLLNQVETLSDIATTFSAFAKMPMPKSERFDLVPLLKHTIRLHENHPGVKLQTDIREESCFVLGDEKLLGRIISNLIINAIQSVPENNNPEIQVLLKKLRNSRVILSVRDNGRGIPEEIRDKIFTPNFSTKVTGSGLGLAIAKHGIEHGGGTIWFDTDENWGTVFHIELPLATL